MTPLFIGIVFLGIGIAFCFRYGWKRVNAYVPLIIGMFLITISTFGPLSKTKAETVEVKNITSQQVTSIVLQPTEKNGVRSIVQHNILIAEPSTIEEICTALNQANVEDENYMKNFAEAGSIKFNLKDNSSFSIGLKRKGQAIRIDVNSSGESGWHYTVLSANRINNILDRVTK